MRSLFDHSYKNRRNVKNNGIISAPSCSTCDMSCYWANMNQQAGQCYAPNKFGGNKMPIGVLCGMKNAFLKTNAQGTFKCC